MALGTHSAATQSARNATVGSTRAALRDGIQLATSATAASSAATFFANLKCITRT